VAQPFLAVAAQRMRRHAAVLAARKGERARGAGREPAAPPCGQGPAYTMGWEREEMPGMEELSLTPCKGTTRRGNPAAGRHRGLALA